MLYAVNIENAHEFGDILAQIHRLRYRQFRERQSYTVPVYKDMEYDQYDTLATVHLVFLDENRKVRGCSRLNPTDRPYMLNDLWPQMIDGELPHSPSVWEGTRICIDKDMSADLREHIKWHIVLGYLEFALDNEITKYIGVMPNFIWRRVFFQSGWGADYLGGEKVIDGIKTRAGEVVVSPDALARVRKTTGIEYAVLKNQYITDYLPSLARAS